MFIFVRQTDLEEGRRGDSMHCAVALAITRKTGMTSHVCDAGILTESPIEHWIPSKRLARYIRRIDAGKSVPPGLFWMWPATYDDWNASMKRPPKVSL